ncbi:MAG: hypothetical protein K6E29_07585 [Cyanobacteria bacterium RUI128]|nr:hypothetical protein [Cyanobacteria bacterium RUI128]
MRLNSNLYYDCQNNNSSRCTFRGNNGNAPKVSCARNPFKKMMPYIFGGLIAIGGISACSDSPEQRFTGNEVNNGIRIEYNDIQKETKDSLMKPVYDLKSKLHHGNDFLEGLDVYVAKSTYNLWTYNSFAQEIKKNGGSNLKGRSFYSDSLLPKMIFIQEDAHQRYADSQKSAKIGAMRQTLMHEVGHQFDNYFGHDHQAEFAQKYDSLMDAKERDMYESPHSFNVKTQEEYKILTDYLTNGSLSDDKKFQKAVWKDINNIRIKFPYSGVLPENMEYYVKSFDLTKPVTPKDVAMADVARGEIYANLFSYAVGQDEGDKEKFIKYFKNSYKVVRSDIAKYLKIVK